MQQVVRALSVPPRTAGINTVVVGKGNSCQREHSFLFSDCQSRVPVAQPRHLFCVPAFRYRMRLYVGSYALLCSAAVSFRGARMLFLISETLFSPLLSEFDFQKDCALKVIKYWAESHTNLSPPRSS